MRNLIVIGMLLTLSGCMMPMFKQPPANSAQAKYKRMSHKRITQRNNNEIKNFSQDGVPIINLMAHQGGANA